MGQTWSLCRYVCVFTYLIQCPMPIQKKSKSKRFSTIQARFSRFLQRQPPKYNQLQVRDLDPTNELTFLRVKSLKHEVRNKYFIELKMLQKFQVKILEGAHSTWRRLCTDRPPERSRGGEGQGKNRNVEKVLSNTKESWRSNWDVFVPPSCCRLKRFAPS